MRQPLIPRGFQLTLVAGALLLPICVCVILGISVMLGRMGDAAGEGVLSRIALGGGILWIIDLVSLLLILAVGSLLHGSDDGPDEP